ncbi:MAG: hypothetical protein AB1Z98_02945, partial [Nannocystaceae bacterium]
AWVDRSRIVENGGGGVLAQNMAEVTLRNCFVGGDISDIPAIEVDGATASILYSTIGAGFGDATALAYSGGTAEVRNSLLVARAAADEVQCGSATFETCASEQDLGGTNVALGEMDTMWFASYAAGNFNLAAAPPAIATTARWRVGDPATDIDGDLRPTEDDSPDHAGADVP